MLTGDWSQVTRDSLREMPDRSSIVFVVATQCDHTTNSTSLLFGTQLPVCISDEQPGVCSDSTLCVGSCFWLANSAATKWKLHDGTSVQEVSWDVVGVALGGDTRHLWFLEQEIQSPNWERQPPYQLFLLKILDRHCEGDT